MSISVDDLVASLNSNHIGQEAMDLATLQTQLAKALYCQSSASYTTPPAGQRGYAQPSNTPTCRTPSTTFSWERSDASRARSSSVASMKRRGSVMEERSSDLEHHVEEMEEDERMVEDLLCPSSPLASHSVSPHLFSTGPHYALGTYNHPESANMDSSTTIHNVHGTQIEPLSNPSTFATTDPFYLAQLQAAQRPSAVSLFAKVGRPSAQSPFLMGEQGPPSNSHAFAHRIPVLPEAEPHHLFAW